MVNNAERDLMLGCHFAWPWLLDAHQDVSMGVSMRSLDGRLKQNVNVEEGEEHDK